MKQMASTETGTLNPSVMAWGSGEAPRVLVVGPDLPHLGVAGSILLHRLFQGWPPSSLLALGPSVASNIPKYPCQFRTYQTPLGRLETTRGVRLLRLLRGLRVVPAGRIAVADFQPDVIVHILSSLAYSEAAYSYSLRSGLPLILILHDDPEDFNGTYSWAGHLTHKQVQRIYRHATSRLCVSPEMELILRERHGVAGTVMYPNRSEAIIPRPPHMSGSLKERDNLTIGFAGSMSYGYVDRLLELAPVFRKEKVKVRVYGGNLPLTSCADVFLHQGRVSTPEALWERVKDECDAVILPYCLPHHGHQKLFRTHFPSKLPEYLALGMPVIITGPSYATGVKWGLSHPGSCVVITEHEGEKLSKALTQLRLDAELRRGLSINSVAAGDRDFEPVAIRSSFQRLLAEVARASKQVSTVVGRI